MKRPPKCAAAAGRAANKQMSAWAWRQRPVRERTPFAIVNRSRIHCRRWQHRRAKDAFFYRRQWFSIVLVASHPHGQIFDSNSPETHADIVEHFKYGSIGAEERAGIPYEIWRVLPAMFPQHLPQRPGTGYEWFGFVFEPGKVRPIGTYRYPARLGRRTAPDDPGNAHAPDSSQRSPAA